ncbi:MAG TPA: NUDIX domain-containing protein [Candidatus Paceibacterota bacterium]|nr:NUDIX domain-containing protein [Candidatus Paceibacterota bacterium]
MSLYKEKNRYLYAIFKRRDLKFWQRISGGTEGKETPLETAKRESFEEAKLTRINRRGKNKN